MQFELMLFWLLLPVAAGSGWWVAWRAHHAKDHKASGLIPPDYFKGLNFVLNEQPDKAIDVFIRLLEVDSETVETHLALGNLFRRRGEIDRAIRIHQNLIARPSLDREQRAHALLELGMDYMRSGLLDRAERLFLELVKSKFYLNQAYTQLLEIYQQEKDWGNAITIARKLEMLVGNPVNPIIAQFYCERADVELTEGNMRRVKDYIHRAMSVDPKCVRSSLIEAQMQQCLGKDRLAIKAYKRVESQDSDYITEIIEPLYACYRKLDRLDEFIEYLSILVTTHGDSSSLLMLAELIAEREGESAAICFISDELKHRPTLKGVDRLIEYILSSAEGEMHKYLKTINGLLGQFIENRATYQCNHCGFSTRSLHWQCPGCRYWGTVKPIPGVAYES